MLKAITTRAVTRLTFPPEVRPRAPELVEDAVAVEEPLEIRVASDPLATTMRTPGEDSRLGVGFLFAEGILRSIDEVGSVAHCGRTDDEGYGNTLDVLPAPGVRWDLERMGQSRRGTLTTSACGVCGRRSVDDLLKGCAPLGEGPPLPAALVARAPELLKARQAGFARTGGTHAAAALSAGGELLAAFEDVGRHNAVDKVVGELLYRRLLPAAATPGAALLVVSGRASFEIVQKAVMARIPVVVSVSALSSLAVDLAERARVTLAGFTRGDGMNVYSHASRLWGGP